jgi:hypothetical protein
MASTYLTRTPSSNGNKQIWTWSGWVKRGAISTWQGLFQAGSNNNMTDIHFYTDDKLYVRDWNGSSLAMYLVTNRLFRDVSAWYHLVVAVDTTQSTASNRVKIYINGTQETSFSTEDYPTQNLDTNFNDTNHQNIIGIAYQISGSAQYYDGSMAHVHWIDGTQYQASDFGETDATTGIWKPKTAPSVTYGTNGFFLKFENSAAFGTDSSGNGNTFTVNGTMTQTIDTPSNVFATLNPLNQNPSNAFVLQNGNLSVASSTAVGTKNHGSSTLGASSGKWYSEFKIDSGLYSVIGVSFNPSELARNNQDCGYYSSGWGYYQGLGTIRNNDSGSAYGDTLSAGDILGIALDLDNSKLYFAKNGVWQNSGDPTSGATGTGAVSITSGETYFFVTGDADASTVTTTSANFGNGFFGTTAVSSAQNPDDGIGIFEYDVPTGYRALCTKSINAEEYS